MAEKIVITDDDASFSKILEKRVRQVYPNCEIVLFNSLQALDEFLKSSPYEIDLLILDEHLPDGRGSDYINNLGENYFPILSVSSDASADMAGRTLKSGAHYFLSKGQVSEGLFQPLISALIQKRKMQIELEELKLKAVVSENINTLVKTLKHEINNPLGTMISANFILERSLKDKDLLQACHLIRESSERIKHVLEQFSKNVELETVKKAQHQVFQVPGDKKW